MTKEQEKAIENVKIFIKSIRSDLVEESKDNQELANDLDTVLSMLKEQQSKIKRLECTLAENHARELNNSIYKSDKSREDLEMLHKGWQIELEKKDKIIDEQLKENVKLQAELNTENSRCMILANNDKFKEQVIDLMTKIFYKRFKAELLLEYGFESEEQLKQYFKDKVNSSEQN